MNKSLTTEDLRRLIEANGGPQGLNLSDYDLSSINLETKDLHGVIFGTDWRTPHLSTAILGKSTLEKYNLQEANFTHVDLSGLSLFGSNLQNANLGVTNCTGTSFNKANLRGVNFHGARLDNTNLSNADLRDSDFHSAYIGNVDLTQTKLGERLLFEDYDKYRAFLIRNIVDESIIEFCLSIRFLKAKNTYRTLKKVYISGGQYKEASWAYVRERKMEKLTHWPPYRARSCYADEIESFSQNGIRQKLQFLKFYLKHFTNYILAWISELTCGYGEDPLRTIWVALATIICFTYFYRLSNGVGLVNNGPMSWLDYWNYSLGSFSTIGSANYSISNSLAQTLTSIEAILGISLLALLMFTLGNRISRS